MKSNKIVFFSASIQKQKKTLPQLCNKSTMNVFHDDDGGVSDYIQSLHSFGEHTQGAKRKKKSTSFSSIYMYDGGENMNGTKKFLK